MTTFTAVHVVISLIAILAGLIVTGGLLSNRRLDGWTAVFLITTVATSLTGFLFPFHGFTPAIGTGIISMIVLVIAIFARYSRRMARAWRWIYVATAMLAFYLNVFVLFVQLFQKVPALRAMAPTQTEPPFAITQLAVLIIFVLLTIIAIIKFRPRI